MEENRHSKTCLEVLLEPYGRVKYLLDRLKGQLDTLRYKKLQRHSSLLRKNVEDLIAKIFQCPRIRFYFDDHVSNEEFCEFLAENKFHPKSDEDIRQIHVEQSFTSELKFVGAVVHITLLQHEIATSVFGDIEDLFRGYSKENKDAILDGMLYVFNFDVNSRTELQENIDCLLLYDEHYSERKESKGCRIFHTGDRMLSQRVSVLFERQVQNSLSQLYDLCDDLSLPLKEDLKQVDLDQVVGVIKTQNDNLSPMKGHWAPVSDMNSEQAYKRCMKRLLLAILQKFGMNIASELSELFAIHKEPRLEFFKVHISNFICGLLFKFIGPQNLCGDQRSIIQRIKEIFQAGGIIFPQFILEESLDIPKIYSAFATEVGEHLQISKTQFLELKTKMRDNEIPHEVVTCLARLPGVLSFGHQFNVLKISVDNTKYVRKRDVLNEIRLAVGSFSEITENNITLCEPYSGITLNVNICSGSTIHSEREGTLTVFARHNKISQGRIFAIFCAHVLPDDSFDGQTTIEMFNCQCQNPSRDHVCSNTMFPIGTCMYSMGPSEENHVNSDFVDIAGCLIKKHVEEKCDLRIFGPKKTMAIIDNNIPLENNIVLKVEPQSEVSFARHIGNAYVLPQEEKYLYSKPLKTFKIPFNGVPRSVELVESTNGERLGQPGHSGYLLSVMSSFDSVETVRPALVYLGQWPENPNKISMCSRLSDSLERLSEKYQGQAEFCLCINNSSHQRESMRSNSRKRKSDDN